MPGMAHQELTRDRVRAKNSVLWISADPLEADSSHKTREGWRPQEPLGSCERCRKRRHYTSVYSVAEHLRKFHFCQRDQGHDFDDPEWQEEGRRTQRWPSIHWLRSNGWMRQIVVGNAIYEQCPTVQHDAMDRMTGKRRNEGTSGRDMSRVFLVEPPQQRPRYLPFSNGDDTPSMLGTSQKNRPTTQYATAMPMQHWPFGTVHGMQTPTPMRTPQVTNNPVAGPVPTGSTNEVIGNDLDDITHFMSEERIVLNVASICRVSRSQGQWLVDVKYEDSFLPRESVGQLLLANVTLSGLAEAAQFYPDHCRVQWRSETVPLTRVSLRSEYTGLVGWLEMMCPEEGAIEWHSGDNAYSIEGSNERYHLCLGVCCQASSDGRRYESVTISSGRWEMEETTRLRHTF